MLQSKAVLEVQVLNSYLTSVTEGQLWQEARIDFWLLEGNTCSKVRTVLPSHGSLGPLLYSCKLISEEQLTAGFGEQDQGITSRHISSAAFI